MDRFLNLISKKATILAVSVVTVTAGVTGMLQTRYTPPVDGASSARAEALPELTAPQQATLTPTRPIQDAIPLEKKAPSLNEDIRLTGIIENVQHPERSFVVIEGAGFKSLTAKVGTSIKQGVVLTKINSDHIYVSKGGWDYRINISRSTVSTAFSVSQESIGSSYAPPQTYVPSGETSPPLFQQKVNSPQEVRYTNNVPKNTSIKDSSVESTEETSTAENVPEGAIVAYASFSLNQQSTSVAESEMEQGTPVINSCNDNSLPGFMCQTRSDAYIPGFMRGGEIDVNWNQVPGYMQTGL